MRSDAFGSVRTPSENFGKIGRKISFSQFWIGFWGTTQKRTSPAGFSRISAPDTPIWSSIRPLKFIFRWTKNLRKRITKKNTKNITVHSSKRAVTRNGRRQKNFEVWEKIKKKSTKKSTKEIMEKNYEKNYGRFVQASCDAQWMTPKKIAPRFFFCVIFFPDVWEAATAVTLVQRKFYDNFSENINGKNLRKN